LCLAWGSDDTSPSNDGGAVQLTAGASKEALGLSTALVLVAYLV